MSHTLTFIPMIVHFIFHLNEQLTFLTMQYGDWIYVILFLIIFCETGLVVTAIMPGDSLLFAAGVIAANGALNIYLLILLLIVAAFSGNVMNYWIGHHFGHFLLRRKKHFFFNPAFFDRTHAFYEKHGGKTIIVARFIPIIRTFAPFIAGLGKMHFIKFIRYNFLGAFFWIVLLLFGSYWFGNVPVIQKNFSLVVFVIIFLSLMPPLISCLRDVLFPTLFRKQV